MPYIYIGRKTTHVGKTLWQLLGNLKDYGVGRLIIRGSQQRYEEPCFLRIARVFPQFHEVKYILILNYLAVAKEVEMFIP